MVQNLIQKSNYMVWVHFTKCASQGRVNVDIPVYLEMSIITPYVSDMTGVTVLTSSVSPSHSHGQTDRCTDFNFSMEVKWKDI